MTIPEAGWRWVGHRGSAMSVSTRPSGCSNTFEGHRKPLYMNSMRVSIAPSDIKGPMRGGPQEGCGGGWAGLLRAVIILLLS